MATNILSFDELISMSSAVSALSEPGANLSFMLPTRDNILAGLKDSVIVQVEPAYADDNHVTLQHIDVFHELTDENGNSDVYRFRIYPEYHGIKKWAEKMANYGFANDLSDLIGLREEVKISFGHRSDYAYIADRKLVALPIAHPSPPTSEEKVGDTEAFIEKEASASISPRHRSRPGDLMSRRNTKRPDFTKAKSLLEDDDTEFDDFYDFEDDAE